jgi:futalosine hydrolase
MLKRVLIVAATDTEADAMRRIPGMGPHEGRYHFGNCELTLLITGVGSAATSWSLMKWISANPIPDLAVNIGIAGSYRDDIVVGDVVVPVSDCFADSGIETEEGFITLSESGLADPFMDKGRIVADNKYVSLIVKILKPVEGITLNTVTGYSGTIQKMLKKYNPGIETMEGATFFYICFREKIPFVALRSISNRVETGSRVKWDISLAVENLSEKLKDFLLMID